MKYFVISDIHSFYSAAKEALDKAGFSPDNNGHTLVVCGDLFDRGNKMKETYRYIKSLPRKILIRGNHESLLETMVERGYPFDHDISNGTAKTICDLNDVDFYDYYLGLITKGQGFPAGTEKTAELVEWIDENFVDYAEFTKYIAVHAWIPTKYVLSKMDKYSCSKVPNPRWRKAGWSDWERARWDNPYGNSFFVKGVPQGKRIIAGHWSASYAWHRQIDTPEFGEGAKFDIWEGNRIIMIDACTAESQKCNVFVFDDDQPVKPGLTRSQRENV